MDLERHWFISHRVCISTDVVQVDRTFVRIRWVHTGWKLQRVVHSNTPPRKSFDVVRFNIFYLTGLRDHLTLIDNVDVRVKGDLPSRARMEMVYMDILPQGYL